MISLEMKIWKVIFVVGTIPITFSTNVLSSWQEMVVRWKNFQIRFTVVYLKFKYKNSHLLSLSDYDANNKREKIATTTTDYGGN